MNTIAYLAYGNRREIQLELTYSVLSVVHFLGMHSPEYRIVLITDEPNRRHDLPVESLLFSEDEFAKWTRNGAYVHEAKVHALLKALDVFGESVILIDTDTYFRSRPSPLFRQVGPGKSVMQASDGILGQHDEWKPILDRVTHPIFGHSVLSTSPMMNSGVVGVHHSNRNLLTDVLLVIGKLYSIHPVFNIEQFAFSTVLGEKTQLTTCHQVIRHYWGAERRFMHSQISGLFPEFSSENFQRYVLDLPKIGYPRKTMVNKLRARLKTAWRKQSANYRFAYLSYLSALSSAATNPIHANDWAATCLDMLEGTGLHSGFIEADFRCMRNPNAIPWLRAEVKERWSKYWDTFASDSS
jgi:hypothetical protein